jgi:hypothetical protein
LLTVKVAASAVAPVSSVTPSDIPAPATTVRLAAVTRPCSMRLFRLRR